MIGGLIIGLIIGFLIGSLLRTSAEDPTQIFISWIILGAIGSTLFFSLWGYADEQQRKVRRPDLSK
jgi:uncharacterized membrane protein YeaQ/YmgE (transglycosylase-associated protein family)